MRVVAVGDNCLDWYLHRNEVFPGGNALNVAVFAKRLGAHSAYVGQFGTDVAAGVMLDALTLEGVDVSRARQVPGTTGYATIELVNGDRVFRGSSNGVVAIELTAEDYEFLQGADAIHTGAHSFLEGSLARLSEIAPVSFDFTNRPDEYCAPLLQHVTTASFSRADLSADQIEQLIAWAHSLGPSEVYVTRGAEGAAVSTGSGVWWQDATPVADVVDTMGAGDSFVAAMLVNRLAGRPLAEASAAASAFAGQACLSYGAIGHGAPADGMTLAPDHKVL